jgi:HAD superfamily hydrolase (TIGR01509 family)
MSKVLLFDCDGVLGDTEQFGHLPAFNQMWREHGVDWQWSVEEYGRKLAIGGGKERMRSLFADRDFLAVRPHPGTEAKVDEIVAGWHRRKSEIYKEIILSGRIPARPGVKRLAEEALAAGWTLGVCSTSKRPSVLAVLHCAMGEPLAGRFALVIAGDEVPVKKPAPDIYLTAADRLGVTPAECLVIEDSRNGLVAADRAGMRCLVTVSGYTRDEGFSEAALVVSSLGDPGGDPVAVLANRSGATVGGWVTVANLDQILAWDRG